jgi:hypothetical protein
MNRYEMQSILLDDIMTNITRDQNLDMVREAVRTYLEVFTNEELEAELIGRGG